MTNKVPIRSETSADVGAIAEVTAAAFKTLAISNQTEHFIIAALRAAKALAISLVAEVDGRGVGHIALWTCHADGCHEKMVRDKPDLFIETTQSFDPRQLGNHR